MTTCENTEAKKDELDDIIVNGSTWAAIWHMSWPLLLQMSSVSVASFCDVWVAGKLGAGVQAAIGICGQVWFFMMMMTVALSAGTTALVSRFWGAKDMETAVLAAKHSMQFAFIFGTVSAILGLAIAKPLLYMLGASPEVQELGWEYMQVDMVSQLPFTIAWIAHAIWRAKGNARTPMMIWFLMTVIIVVLDIVFCMWPLHLGIRGIGLAWVIAAFVGTILNLYLLGRTDLKDCVDLVGLWKMGISKDWFKRLFNIGIPA
ncbi:MAG: polysaccharide biosynthesis C-terminal domain-containing protein, partial [Cyanobacteria bacterium]|nr:polysaccharide biosynthesis C-terminal domain-containing protein [Cyanobacteriota bacterium]